MVRWILFCVLLSAIAVAAVWAVAPKTPPDPVHSEGSAVNPKAEVGAADPAGPIQPVQPVKAAASQLTSSQRPLPRILVYAKLPEQTFAEPIVIPGCSLVIVEQQEVPAEKDGKILFIGTNVQPGEVVPPEKQLPKAMLGFLAVPVAADEQLKEGEEKFKASPEATTWYRRVRETDQLKPNEVGLFFEEPEVRKLQVGDKVKRGQLLALVNPRRSFDDVAMKVAKLNQADSERISLQKQRDEFQRRYQRMLRQNQLTPRSVPEEEIGAALSQRDKFAFEEKAKAAEVVRAQRELNAGLTDLRMHEIRAAIDGVIKVIYKNTQGEAVKPMDPVVQIQNPSRLRVEGMLEVQEALKLKGGMKVFVEASRPEHPRLVISGHLNTVNCVAVSKDKRVIVSGSEDETLRGWDSATGAKLWLMSGLKSAVRAASCTPPGAKHNLVLFGCADGTIRLLDLDNTKEAPRDLAERHQGPVNGVAFSPDGEICATCSEDRNIFLWKTETGELLYRLPQVHRGPVTSVQFASATRLVSAGRDNRLAVYDVEAGKPPVKLPPEFSGRGGEVTQIGVSPDGRTVLFDQGKELRLLSVAGGQIEGTLQNPSEAMNFSTMALFAPDGKTILTNSPAPGKLQLWRTPTAQARATELRQFIWMKGTATCGAFAPENGFAVTGTQDHQVLVWAMPEKDEVESRLEASLTLVEKHLDTQSRQVRVWAELQNPGWLIPGTRATMVVPPQK